MNILMIMIPLAFLLSASFLAAFLWATSEGQFDDTLTPAHKILVEEDSSLVSREEKS